MLTRSPFIKERVIVHLEPKFALGMEDGCATLRVDFCGRKWELAVGARSILLVPYSHEFVSREDVGIACPS